MIDLPKRPSENCIHSISILWQDLQHPLYRRARKDIFYCWKSQLFAGASNIVRFVASLYTSLYAFLRCLNICSVVCKAPYGISLLSVIWKLLLLSLSSCSCSSLLEALCSRVLHDDRSLSVNFHCTVSYCHYYLFCFCDIVEQHKRLFPISLFLSFH